MRTFRRRDSQLNATIDLAVGIVKDLLEVAATSSLNPDLFINRLSRTMFLNPSNPKSVVHNLDIIADCRYYGVISYLRENYYRLTQDDLIFCSLICFDFAPSVISMLYEHTNDHSYYNKRTRLRIKLEIPEGEHIGTYLKQLIQTLSPEKL